MRIFFRTKFIYKLTFDCRSTSCDSIVMLLSCCCQMFRVKYKSRITSNLFSYYSNPSLSIDCRVFLSCFYGCSQHLPTRWLPTTPWKHLPIWDLTVPLPNLPAEPYDPGEHDLPLQDEVPASVDWDRFIWYFQLEEKGCRFDEQIENNRRSM